MNILPPKSCEAPGLYKMFCGGGINCLALADIAARTEYNKGLREYFTSKQFKNCPQDQIEKALTELESRSRNSQ